MLSWCVRPSVRPSVTNRYCIERTGEIELSFGMELPLTYLKPCFKKIRVPPKIRVLPSGTLLQTLDLENFSTASRWSTKVVDGRACGLRPRRSSALWLDAQSLLHFFDFHYFDLFLICCTTCSYRLHCCTAVGKFLTGTSRRAVRLR